MRIGSLPLAIVCGILVAAALPVPTAGAPPATPRDLVLYLHNATVGRTVNGVSTPYTMDTEPSFGAADNATAAQQVRQDWYVYPTLAADLPVNGSIRAHVYVDVSGATPNVNPTFEVWERDAAGAETLIAAKNLGNVPWWNTPHDLAMATDPVVHTFAVGSSIRIVLDLVAGMRTATIWWNASWVPSHLILPAEDFAQPTGLAFLDAAGSPRTTFDPMAADPRVTFEATVRDPLGGYDVAWVNLTVVALDGSVALDNASMAWSSGAPVDLFTTWRYAWTYAGLGPGTYRATVRVLDRSGHGYWLANFDVGPYGAALDGAFAIGDYPLSVHLRVADARDVPLEGASLDVRFGGGFVSTATTDAQGLADLRAFAGTYEVHVRWQGVEVAAPSLVFMGNVTATNAIPIAANVVYPSLAVEDADGVPLAAATVFLTHPNGTLLPPIASGPAGYVNLTQVPAGTWPARVAWRGVDVFAADLVLGDGPTVVAAEVYRLTVQVKDARGNALPGAFVSARDGSGLVFDADLTDRHGRVVLRLPAGTYTVRAAYRTANLGTTYADEKEIAVTVDASRTVDVTFLGLPITLTNTVVFQVSVVLGLFALALLSVTVRLWRKVKRLEDGQATPRDDEE